MHLIFIVNEKI